MARSIGDLRALLGTAALAALAACRGPDAALGLLVLAAPRQADAARPYAAGATPVTCAEYAVFVQETGAPPPRAPEALFASWGRPDLLDLARRHAWPGPVPPEDRLDHPVTLVPFAYAQAFCAFDGRRRGLRGRLPAEAEWMALAGAGDGRAYPWGDAYDPRRLNDATAGPGTTTPVGAYPEGAAPTGALDVAGNVYEWTVTPGSEPATRIVKGGSFASPPEDARLEARRSLPEAALDPRVGFRCVFDRR